MDAAEFEQLLVELREGRVHVRVGLEEPHASSTLAVASSLARQRAERIAHGDRVAYVYNSPEDSDDNYSKAAIIDAEQARRLLAAGAVELGAEKGSPAPAPSLSWGPTFPDTASRASTPVIVGGMTAPEAVLAPNQTEEVPGSGPLTDDDSPRSPPVYNTVQSFTPAQPAQTEELPGRAPIDDDFVPPQPVISVHKPHLPASPAQTDELSGTTDAKASADQRQGAVASSMGDSSITATGTVQGSPSAALNQEERVAEDRSTATGVESAPNVRSGVGTAAGTSKVTAVGASIAAGTGTAAGTSTVQAVAESVQVPGVTTAASAVGAGDTNSAVVTGYGPIETDSGRVELRHGDLLSDESCDLIVLPSSSIGSMRHWVAQIVAKHRLDGPTILEFGTIGAVQYREFATIGAVQYLKQHAFVFAASVDQDSRSSPEAIERIGQALGRLSGFQRIAAPLLGAGTNEDGKERMPATVAFEALRAGFCSVPDAGARLVVLVPDAARFEQLQSAVAASRGEPGASSLISGFRSDAIKGEDLLDIEDEVEALCSVIAASDITPPLSIGLFGDWGSGKSFFIDRMKRRLDDLAVAARRAEQDSKAPAYCSHITQLEFNAWRYIDTDLWASLAAGIIDGLARSLDESKDATVEQRARLLAATARSRNVLEQAEQRRQEARDKLVSEEERLHRLSDQAYAPSSAAIVERAARELAVAKTAELRTKLGEVAKKLGQDAKTNGAKAALLDLQGMFADVRAVWLCFRSQPASTRILRLVLPIAVFVAVTLVIGAIDHTRIDQVVAWSVKIGTTVLAAFGSAAPLLKRAHSATAEIRGLAVKYQTMLDDERRAHQSKLDRQHERLQAELADAEERVREAKADLATLEEQLDALRADRLVAEFIRKRHASDDYRKHFGVIARARDDFEQLSKLLVQARAERSSGGDMTLPRIDRIVLYVDDLDRCNEEQVVKVLQAVHLLLAFELFVVVVAVDSRWLLHSLQQHSKAFHSEPTDLAGIPVEERGHWQSTPLNYLEKIFQIPFSLNPMDRIGFGKMIDSLVAPLDGNARGVPGTTRADDERAADASATRAEASAGTTPTGADGATAGAVPTMAKRAARAPFPGGEVATSGSAPTLPGAEARAQARGSGPAPDSRIAKADAGAGARARPPIDVHPRHLKIDEREQLFMKLLHALVPSPRATKRFVNIYRLLRAGIPQPRLEAFTDDATGGEYRATLLLLAVMIGFPTQAAELMRCLVEERPEGDWWNWLDGFLAKKREVATRGTPAGRRWEDAAVQMSALKESLAREAIRLPACSTFRFWAPRIARFSFESGRLAIAPDDVAAGLDGAPHTQRGA